MEIKDHTAYTCCFLGHRNIDETADLKLQLYTVIEKMIIDENVDTFLFGSKSQFNSLCYELVTQIKEKYPHIKRIYVRAEFPVVRDSYRAYLLENYEHTYYPDDIIGAGKAAYIKRNYNMIDNSRFCIFYYKEKHAQEERKSGTKIAFNYAVKRRKKIYHFPFLHCRGDQ